VSDSDTSSDIGKEGKEAVDVDGEAVREGTSPGAEAVEMADSDGERKLSWSSLHVSRGFLLVIAAIVRRAAKVQYAMCVPRCRRWLVLLSEPCDTLQDASESNWKQKCAEWEWIV
jgi:hypothetical protein